MGESLELGGKGGAGGAEAKELGQLGLLGVGLWGVFLCHDLSRFVFMTVSVDKMILRNGWGTYVPAEGGEQSAREGGIFAITSSRGTG